MSVFVVSCSNMASTDEKKMVVKLIPENALSIRFIDPMYEIGDTVILYRQDRRTKIHTPYKVVVVREEQ